MPKYERVDDTQLKITREVSRIIDVPKLVTAKKQILEEIENMKEKLANVEEALKKAKDLGMDVTKEAEKIVDESNDNKDTKKAK